MINDEKEQDGFSEGWDEAETPTDETGEKKAETPEETPPEEPEGEENEPEKTEVPTPKGEEKPWYETDTTLNEEVRQKIRSFNGMFVSERKKREVLEAEVSRLKIPPKEKEDESAAYNFEAAEDRYVDALIDGDKETASAIRREIEARRKEAWLEEAEKKTRGSIREEKEQEFQRSIGRDLAEVAARAYEKFPFLNPEADLVNNKAIKEVKAKRDEYYNLGTPIKEALQKAVDEVAPQFSKTGNSDKHRKMEAVKTRSTPVSGGGKGKADKNDFDGAWDEA